MLYIADLNRSQQLCKQEMRLCYAVIDYLQVSLLDQMIAQYYSKIIVKCFSHHVYNACRRPKVAKNNKVDLLDLLVSVHFESHCNTRIQLDG